MKKVTAASIALTLMASTAAVSQETKFDKNISDAAAKRAAERIGDIRGSIDYDQKAEMVTREHLEEKQEAKRVSLIPDYVWYPEKANIFTRLIAQIPGIDLTVTGSVDDEDVQIERKLVWDKFDAEGNPIK